MPGGRPRKTKNYNFQIRRNQEKCENLSEDLQCNTSNSENISSNSQSNVPHQEIQPRTHPSRAAKVRCAQWISSYTSNGFRENISNKSQSNVSHQETQPRAHPTRAAKVRCAQWISSYTSDDLRERNQLRRAKESKEARDKRLQDLRHRASQRIANENVEQREQRLEDLRQRALERRVNGTVGQRLKDSKQCPKSSTMPKCCVPLCSNRKGFVFPKDPELKKKWLHAIKREQIFTPNARTIVCEAHFTKKDFATEGEITGLPITERRRLKKGAIPSIFMRQKPKIQKIQSEQQAWNKTSQRLQTDTTFDLRNNDTTDGTSKLSFPEICVFFENVAGKEDLLEPSTTDEQASKPTITLVNIADILSGGE